VALLNPGAAVMDTVYNPLDTPLLLAAPRGGLKNHPRRVDVRRSGGGPVHRLDRQAAPRALFERIARERLSGA
jgi:hypothetical protein